MRSGRKFVFVAIAGLILLATGATLSFRSYRARHSPAPGPAPAPASASDAWPRPPVRITPGKVRAPLPYRIVSFHRGWADKRLVKLAADLGFNGVQIQIEGTTVDGIKTFSEWDAKEHLVDYCHQLGMQVTLWVHELNDMPPEWMPEWLGPPTPDNQKLWTVLEDRYEWMLRDAVPNVDGLVLTVVETRINATDAKGLAKLASVVRGKCDKYGKKFILRTFVWYPDEFAGVMAAINQLPPDTIIMSKCTPQDWQMRGTFASEIGNVGGRPQIVEYDVAGEYFLKDIVANCMPEVLKKHFDYGLTKNVQGVCVRMDRDEVSVLHAPQEVNLWTLGMLASGASDNLDEIWKAWAENRYGKDAADGVVKALKPTGDVVAEMLSIGNFTFADTRYFPPLPDENVFGQILQNYWWDKRYEPEHQDAEVGEPKFTENVKVQKARAAELAAQCLTDLEAVRDKLTTQDYEILKARLLTNQAQLAFRAPMAMAVLHHRRMANTWDEKVRKEMDQAIQADLGDLRRAVRHENGYPTEIAYFGRKWKVGIPLEIWREAIFHWAYKVDQLRQGIDPRDPEGRKRDKR